MRSFQYKSSTKRRASAAAGVSNRARVPARSWNVAGRPGHERAGLHAVSVDLKAELLALVGLARQGPGDLPEMLPVADGLEAQPAEVGLAARAALEHVMQRGLGLQQVQVPHQAAGVGDVGDAVDRLAHPAVIQRRRHELIVLQLRRGGHQVVQLPQDAAPVERLGPGDAGLEHVRRVLAQHAGGELLLVIAERHRLEHHVHIRVARLEDPLQLAEVRRVRLGRRGRPPVPHLQCDPLVGRPTGDAAEPVADAVAEVPRRARAGGQVEQVPAGRRPRTAAGDRVERHPAQQQAGSDEQEAASSSAACRRQGSLRGPVDSDPTIEPRAAPSARVNLLRPLAGGAVAHYDRALMRSPTP